MQVIFIYKMKENLKKKKELKELKKKKLFIQNIKLYTQMRNIKAK